MGLDFDPIEYCKNLKLRQSNPPYSCPVSKCDRSYRSVIGLQYHLQKYDHDNPQPLTPILTQNRKKARSRGAKNSTPKGGPKGGNGGNGDATDNANGNINGKLSKSIVSKHININPENLVSYNEEEKTVQFNIDGKSVRWSINEPLPFVEDDEYAELVSRGCIINANAPPLEENATWARVQVPEARYKEIEDYNVPDAPARPLAYYRFIEKSAEELDGEIEYDVDEEDTAWLEWMNEQREKTGINTVAIDTMELLMDRLEKESYFQAAANGTPTGVEVDDDAVCCICMDGECQNTNVILFCDMCNLAVHQDCYGVPYIPEGQWLCRRCLQSPSTPVNCVLCPNTGGAFKQTDRGQWAHVVCALWIPEVRFANTVFLEPIDSIETIPPARWRLTCYVCKEKGLGACIQCHRNSCYAAFHVTCAQQAGLYMTMDTVKDGHNDSSVHVQKYAYCHAHTPADAKLKTNQKEVEDTRHKMREARKALAKKRSSAPVVLIPTIPPDRVQEIASMVHMQKKSQFLDRLIAYWTLKRQYRNGVPLLRRLQSQGSHHGVIHRTNGMDGGTPDANELYRQLKYWQCLRQDLERARLLCELVRKREKLKAAYVKICEQCTMFELNPLESALTKLLDALEARDTSEIFREPVDTNEVPDYLDIVTHPMDLGTMREKLKRGEYATLEQLEVDFDLMIQNCLAYNNKDTVFYRAGIRMRDQAAPLFQQVRKELQRDGLLDESQHSQTDHVEAEVEAELKQLLNAKPSEEIVQKLLILADKSQVLKNPSYRTKKIKQIRVEIQRMRKAIQKARIESRSTSFRNRKDSQTEHDDDDDDDDDDDADITMNESDLSLAKKFKDEQEKLRQKQQQQYQTPRRSRRPTVTASRNNYVVDDDDEEDDEADADENEHENENEEDEDDTMGEESKATTIASKTPPCSPIKSLNNSASPVGVNRRTAVLFTRKAQAALKKPTETQTTPVKEEHAAANQCMSSNLSTNSAGAAALTATLSNSLSIATAAASAMSLTANSNSSSSNKLGSASNSLQQQLLSPLSASLGFNSNAGGGGGSGAVKSPKRTAARHKRLTAVDALRSSASSTSAAAAAAAAMSPKKSPSTLLPVGANMSGYERIPDSFRVYRANNERDVSESDDDDMHDISCSSCSGFSSGSGSEYDSSDMEEDEDELERRRFVDEDDEDGDGNAATQHDDDTGGGDDGGGFGVDDNNDDDVAHDDVDGDVIMRDVTRASGNGNASEESNHHEHATKSHKKKAALARSSKQQRTTTAKTKTTKSAATTTIIPATTKATATARKQKRKSKRATPTVPGNEVTTTPTPTITSTPDPEPEPGADLTDRAPIEVNSKTNRNRRSSSNKIKHVNKVQTRASTPSVPATATTTANSMSTTSTSTTPISNHKSKKASGGVNHRSSNSKLINNLHGRVASNAASTPTPPPTQSEDTNTTNAALDESTSNANAINNNDDDDDNTIIDHVNDDDATANDADHYPDDDDDGLMKPPLEPLQLVWAKCRGYPWYPALILDPKTPKGFVYNGVPLPAPPQDVLALRKNCIEDVVYLVLFFDAKRTWQWLPASKLEILGIDKRLDQAKLVESRKPTERKAVKKAYQDALHYQSQVSDLEGQGPDPIM